MLFLAVFERNPYQSIRAPTAVRSFRIGAMHKTGVALKSGSLSPMRFATNRPDFKRFCYGRSTCHVGTGRAFRQNPDSRQTWPGDGNSRFRQR
ncbi:hypothetical protein Pcar_3193 [Syntrophotalea carbinolica DSM 2380]|uniref:Uncharacterized protein n=1 Tax=Syntrophotalea carbinolica (strain DSM 2380 / NBRC 103641 / GraBd1) TaxID=338963 RepID=Q0C6X4_SYNC1|nr:hypothetical protein Pcar_3193 [Syntrophotalea carbinolica DSM 2380]